MRERAGRADETAEEKETSYSSDAISMYSNMADNKFIAIMMTFYDAVKTLYYSFF